MQTNDQPEGSDQPVEGGPPPAEAEPSQGAEEGTPSLETATADVQALLRRLETLEGEVGDLRNAAVTLAAGERLDAIGLTQGDTNERLTGLMSRVTELEGTERIDLGEGPEPIDAGPAAEPVAASPPLDADLGPGVRLGDVASGSLVDVVGLQYVVVGPVAGGDEDAPIKVRRGQDPYYLDADTMAQVIEQPEPAAVTAE